MDKHRLIEKLAVLYGIDREYNDDLGRTVKTSSKECQEFLNCIGINTDKTEILLDEVKKIEESNWLNPLPAIKIIKQGSFINIDIAIPYNKGTTVFEWTFEEENEKVYTGTFKPTDLKIKDTKIINNIIYNKVELILSIHPSYGYHQFKITDKVGYESSMKIIIIPRKCYKPLSLEINKKIKGYQIYFNQNNKDFSNKIYDYKQLKEIINLAKHTDNDVIGIDSPSPIYAKKLFNTSLINVDEVVKFIEENDISFKRFLNELNEEIKKQNQQENKDFKEINKIKFKIFKVLYQSFREKHINQKTPKAQAFFKYISSKDEDFKKYAVFEAIKEHFLCHDNKFSNWHEWPKDYQNPHSEEVLLFEKNNKEMVEFYQFLQWQAELQFEEAAKTSLENKLGVGIFSNLSFHTINKSCCTWLNQDFHALKASLKLNDPELENDFVFSPFIPHQLRRSGYKSLKDLLTLNMYHTGAIKIQNISSLFKNFWKTGSNTETAFPVNYPFDEIMGILALESRKNKCAVVYEEDPNISPYISKKLEEYGLIPETVFKFEEISSIEDIKIKNQTLEMLESSQKKECTDKIPLSTYRLQFNKYFTFKDAQKIIPYLKEIGISHCYASPILWAKTGSLHGYDIINHSKINPEIGTQEDFDELANIINENKMGLILDIVPNHMGLGNENKWWMDVLENGQASEYANFFDIDWEPIKQELSGKVLVPILGDHYGNILINGQFKFNFDREKGLLKLLYYEHEFPINPSSYPIILGHRIDILESRLGNNDSDFLEYQSIINMFKKLPGINETSSEKIKERNREKSIAFKRLSEVCQRNSLVTNFIEENLFEFKCQPDNSLVCERTHNLLEAQAYRLAYWRVSADIINYRRFFDVNSLIGLRTENSLVFTYTHSLILDLIEQKKIHGLRIDHPDGLLDPTNYFKTLQLEAGKRLGVNFDVTKEKYLSSEQLPFYVVAEKILASFEKLPQNWAVHGTIGYEFLNSVNNLFLETKNAKKFSQLYNKFVNKTVDFNKLVIKCKKLIMKTALTSELSTLSNNLSRISEKYYSTRDYTLNGLRYALMEIISCFPVYRTYISEEDKSTKAMDYIKWAIGTAKKRSPSTDPSIYDFIEKILLCEFETDKKSEVYNEILNFAMKFQQYTGPLMAKGLEDTSFFNYNRLIALNEVGGNPANFGISVADFHNIIQSRLNTTPHGILATSTHDTKLSEDVRARICVLSEIPDIWQKKIIKWSKINKSKKTKADQTFIPDKNDEYLFYQILTGIWPEKMPDGEEMKNLIQRIENHMIKAIREAKVHTSWINMNFQYENALSEFIKRVLNSPENHPFWKEFLPFQKEIAFRGYINSISQITLKFTSPGVPDIYQGNELWKYNLVDPDNRNPVDFNQFQELYKEIQPLLHCYIENTTKNLKDKAYLDGNSCLSDVSCLFPIESGKLKLFITSALLNFRKKHTDLFKNGNYIPIEIKGQKSENLVAFARNFGNETIIIVVPRLVYHMVSEKKPFPVGETIWKDTKIILPEAYSDMEWQDIFTGKYFYADESQIKAGSIFSMLPVCVLYSNSDIT